MDIESIKAELKDNEESDLGEIVNETDTTVEWYDYEFSYDDHTVIFRDGNICTKDLLLSLCHITDKAKTICGEYVTPEIMCSILADAYGDILPDMMATLRGVVIIKDAEDLEEAFRLAGISSSGSEIDEHLVGITIFDSQLCLVIAEPIMKKSKEIVDRNSPLPEDEYPSHVATEEQVEEFARQKWDCMRASYVGK